jgi:penicillin-binding protein 1B
MLGYERVMQLAQASGVTNLKPTPSMSIGAYDATPLEMAEAYTVFANGGVRQPAVFIRGIRSALGQPLEHTASEEKANVLDPRTAAVMTDMLGAVLDSGTAAAVRARFNEPAAGKTGTSHDAWFAGYTSNLLCIVWVGNDDYSDIKIEGAKAAAPIWTEFMLRARKLRRYREMEPFSKPPGVVAVKIDKVSNLPADDSCPDDYEALFIDGTVPAATCGHPEGPSRNFFEKVFGIGVHRELVLPPVTQTPANPNAPVTAVPNQPTPGTPAAPQPEVKKKRGFWKRIFGMGKKDQDTSEPQPSDTNH